MGTYRREYAEYYRELKGGLKWENSDLYIGPRGIYKNDISKRSGLRSGYNVRRKREKPTINLIFTEIVASMLLFLVLISFSILNSTGNSYIYRTSKNIIERNYTVEEVKDLFGIRSFIKNLKLNVK